MSFSKYIQSSELLDSTLTLAAAAAAVAAATAVYAYKDAADWSWSIGERGGRVGILARTRGRAECIFFYNAA
jgi:hypothetical protein